MTKAAQSIFVFGLYMLGEGAILLLFPNLLLQLVAVPETTEVWIRLLGISLMVLGYYYIRAARSNMVAFFGWTVHMRLVQFGIITGLVLLGIGQSIILGFAAVEAAFGIWTWVALRKVESH